MEACLEGIPSIHFYNVGPTRLLAYKGKITAGDIRLADHDECLWVDLQDLREVRLAPADVPFHISFEGKQINCLKVYLLI